jgi:hypothetical protein
MASFDYDVVIIVPGSVEVSLHSVPRGTVIELESWRPGSVRFRA